MYLVIAGNSSAIESNCWSNAIPIHTFVTCFYLIEKETPAFPCKYAKDFPKEAFAIKYSLNISKFKAKPLEDILIK